MALCNVTGTVYLPNGQLARSRTIVFKRTDRRVTAEYLGTVLPDDVLAQTSTTGQIAVSLLTGNYSVHTEGGYIGRVGVPDETAAYFADLIEIGEIPAVPPAWFDAMKPVITVFTDEAAFNAYTPGPLELAVLTDA